MSVEEKKNCNTAADEEFTEENISEQRQVRRNKLKQLQESGRNPYIEETWNVDAWSRDIKENFETTDSIAYT